MVFSHATGVDYTNGTSYHVTYQYGVGGPRTFDVNLHLVTAGGDGDYAEHDLFLFDSVGNVTRAVISQTCH